MAGNAAANPMSRSDLEQKIVALAWKDDAFRKAFLANPKGEFEKRLGVKLPANLTMTAHAEDDGNLHFVIPAKPATVSELSDADLEKVAGGIDVIITISLTVALSTGGGLVAAGVGGIVNDDNEAAGRPHW